MYDILQIQVGSSGQRSHRTSEWGKRLVNERHECFQNRSAPEIFTRSSVWSFYSKIEPKNTKPSCGRTGDSHHACAADESAEMTWCSHVDMEQAEERFPTSWGDRAAKNWRCFNWPKRSNFASLELRNVWEKKRHSPFAGFSGRFTSCTSSNQWALAWSWEAQLTTDVPVPTG